MPKGYHDRLAFVDLSQGKVWYEAYGEAFWRRYLGGRALAAYLLLKHVPKGADPLGPENALVFAPGVLTGTPISGSGRNTVAAKSPLTGGYGDAEGGGFFGAELKNAGLDALVVLGKAESPVYLHVEGGEVAIHPAFHLWGKDPLEVEALIKEVHGRQHPRRPDWPGGGERGPHRQRDPRPGPLRRAGGPGGGHGGQGPEGGLCPGQQGDPPRLPRPRLP
jgi:aldehyde:ferredoxin oxidoreductase